MRILYPQMSSRSLHKKNSGKLQSLKCFELKFAVADSQIERGNTILCKMERPSPTGIMHFYKMPVNTLSPPSVIRDSTPFVSRSRHSLWPFPLTITGIYVTNSSRPQRSCDTFSKIIRQIWINESQISPTSFRRAFIENNSRISSDRESQRHRKVTIDALNYTFYKTSTFNNNHLV